MLETTRPSVTEAGRHMGDLSRGGTNWKVYLETQPHGQLVSGRIHFVSDQGNKSTTWIFLEWSDQDAIHRFNEFSPIELWKILESLG